MTIFQGRNTETLQYLYMKPSVIRPAAAHMIATENKHSPFVGFPLVWLDDKDRIKRDKPPSSDL